MKWITGNNLETDTKQSNSNRDALLIGLVANGDESALEKLYYLYHSRLLRFIVRITGRVDQADEIINEVMYVVWLKAGTFNHSCQLSTWIFGIAYNKSRKSLKKSTFDQAESLNDMDCENKLFGQYDSGIKQLETKNWLEAAFKVLSLDQRSVIELTYFHGMHYREIANLMDCPENTIKTRMFHARKKLASFLLTLENSTLNSED